MTIYMDNLCMFFNTKSQPESAFKTLNEFIEIIKIKGNPTKSEYVAINCKDATPLSINSNLISPANKKNNIGLLDCFLNTKSLLKSSTPHAKKTLTNECKKIRNK
jgi:hypothetical protein